MVVFVKKVGAPINIEEFIKLRKNNYSPNVRGLLGRDLYKIPKKSLILDTGCGIGNILFSLNHNGFKAENLYGFDIEENLIAFAKGSISANFFVGTIESIPVKDEVFDYIAAYDLLEHIPNYNLAVSEMSRVLKRGRIVYMTVADGYSLNDILFRIGGKIIHGRSSHIQKFKKDDVIKLFKRNSFKVKEINHIKGCLLVYLSIEKSLPFILRDIIKSFGKFLGRFMSVAWEFKAMKSDL